MWVPTISSLNLSLIGSLTMEIYHRTEITGNAHRRAQKLNVTLFPGRVNRMFRIETYNIV